MQWEYEILLITRKESFEEVIQILNGMGEGGWELAMVVENSFYFKRPITSSEAKELAQAGAYIKSKECST